MAYPEQIAALHRQQREAILAFAREPRRYAGRGIVTSIFDRQFPLAWVLLSELARLGVQLPIEAFHRPNELSAGNAELARSLGLKLTLRPLTDPVTGFPVKPYSIWRSSFREVLWLDADSYPLRDPAFLFDDPEYQAKGSLFWRDVSGAERAVFWHPRSKVWPTFNVPPNDAEEFESGQLLIDKEKCWPELGLTLHFNAQYATYYSYVLGDKDTFRLAWQNLAAARKKAPPGDDYLSYQDKVPYGFMPYGPFHMGRPNRRQKWGGGTIMVQRDRHGSPLFVHRNMQKFSLTEENFFNADVPNEAVYHGHIDRLRALLRPSPAFPAAPPA
jgi:alpha 1,2-mannosyltransferase